MAYIVYILSCSDGSFHSGVTKNLTARLLSHQSGENPDLPTFHKLPVHLVFEQNFTDIRQAVAIERNLQSYSAAELKLVISGEKKLGYSTFNQEVNKRNDSEEKTLILPITYLGNLAYYAELDKIDRLIVDVNEPYEKQTYRSRCTILSANGIQNLVVPVIRPNGKLTLVKEVEISYAENWQKDHLKALESAYRNTPYFEFYADELFKIISKKHHLLMELNLELTQFLIRVKNLNCTVKIGDKTQLSTVAHKLLIQPKNRHLYQNETYHQVFETDQFEANLSCIDRLFNVGR